MYTKYCLYAKDNMSNLSFYVEILFFNNYLLRYYPSISQFSCYLKA